MPSIVPPEEDGKYVEVLDSHSDDGTSQYTEEVVSEDASDTDAEAPRFQQPATSFTRYVPKQKKTATELAPNGYKEVEVSGSEYEYYDEDDAGNGTKDRN